MRNSVISLFDLDRIDDGDLFAIFDAVFGIHLHQVVDEWVLDQMFPDGKGGLDEIFVQRDLILDEWTLVGKGGSLIDQIQHPIFDMRRERIEPALERSLLTRTVRPGKTLDEVHRTVP